MMERVQLDAEDQVDLEIEVIAWFEMNSERFPIPEEGAGWEIEVRTREGRLMGFQVSGNEWDLDDFPIKEYEVSCAWQKEAFVPPH